MSQLLQTDDELCPNCGEFVAYLHEDTGFCYPCSGIQPARRCSSCNSLISDGSQSTKCHRCNYISWLERNADEIERVMSVNCITSGKARKIVKANNRAICLSCAKPIKGGTSGKHFFCRTTLMCKKAGNIYRYNRSKNRSHDESIKKAMDAIVIMRLLNNRGTNA